MKKQNSIALSTLAMAVMCSLSYADEPEELQGLTVTAQKKAENVQEVPISMTLMDDVAIADNNIELIEDIAAMTPNLMFFSYGMDTQISPSLRGIFSDMEAKNVPMAIYIDGVPILDGWAMNEALDNIERIEVLKGPQGTLYGKNSEAGVINIHTKQASNETRRSIGIELGSDNKRKANLNLSGAVIEDKFFADLSLMHYEKDGFLIDKNTGDPIDDRQRDAARLSLIYAPSDALRISLINSILKYDDDSIKMSYASQGKRDISQNFRGYNRSQIVNNALKIRYQTSENGYIESVTTRRDFDLVDGDDWDFSDDPEMMFHMERDSTTLSYSQEFRYVDSFLDDRLDFLAGVYADKKDEDFDLIWTGFLFSKDFDDKSLGIFTHIKYQVSDKLAVLGGLRYDEEEKKFAFNMGDIKLKDTYSAVSPKLSLEYQLAPKQMSYFTIAKGYRAGGYNHMAPKDHQNLQFGEELLWNYELGYKGTLLENKLTLNAALYFMDIQDMQVTTATGPDEEYLSNAAEATSQGAELEVNYQLNEKLSLQSALGLNDIEFKEFSDNSGDYTGNTNPFAPKYNYNIGLQYRDMRGFYARVNLNGYGKMYFDKENEYSKDALSLLNAKIGYETENYDVYVYGKNILDEEHDSVGYYNGVYTIYADEPEFGVQAVYRF